MDFGSEISAKIKAAIKTKLQELGSYVDDELPEYIMVMLGNKRSKKQMTEDLTLFLGGNTLKFIEWLLNLVDKLKDVTSLIDCLPSDNAAMTSDDTSNDTKVEPKQEQNVKQTENRDKKKSSKTTSKEQVQSKPGKSVQSRSDRSHSSNSVNKHGHRKRKISESDEEETPVKTQMPSVVKVQEKTRPSLPPSKQATSSLLKRAVAEAHMSVTKANPPHSHIYDPTSPPSPIKVHSIEEKRQQKEILLQQHRELQKKIREKELEETEEEQPKIYDYENDLSSEEVKETDATPSDNQQVPSSNVEIENEPLIELQVSEAEALEYSSENIKGDTRIVAFADSQTTKDTEEEEKHKRRKKRAVKSRDCPRSPKFIVTLDGVDSDLEDKYEKQASKRSRHKKHKSEFDDYIEVDTSNMPTTPVVAPAPEKPEYLPPAVEKVMFRVDPNSDDEEMQQYPVPSTKPQERCKFWPDCNNGTNCPYYHPTAPCRTFPNCKFADKCMFIHPCCKFDGRCTNVSCPYTHKLKTKLRSPVAAPAPVVIEPKIDDSLPTLAQLTPCKFFPGCTRSNCPYLHPKPTATKVCRYGTSCSRIDCKFNHPPSKAALKWVSPSLHLSERPFALPAENVTKMPVAS